MKTVLVAGVGWPEVGEWPVKEEPKFKHVQKPVRVIKPKTKKKAVLSEAFVAGDVFMHPKGNNVRRESCRQAKKLLTPSTKTTSKRTSRT